MEMFICVCPTQIYTPYLINVPSKSTKFNRRPRRLFGHLRYRCSKLSTEMHMSLALIQVVFEQIPVFKSLVIGRMMENICFLFFPWLLGRGDVGVVSVSSFSFC